MATFLNKKEQVFDLKLTTYGHYLMSIGKFKPAYYTFSDDNVLYDAQYAGVFERQNEINKRIKEDTPYLEGLTLFHDVEKSLISEGTSEISFYSSQPTITQKTPQKSIYRFSATIGDGQLNGEPQKAPSWKIVMLAGTITSSAARDDVLDIDIPQLNIDSVYKKTVMPNYIEYAPGTTRDLLNRSEPFKDNNVIALIANNPVVYFEESNTELLTENFEIEIFEILTGSDDEGNIVTQLQRKYFPSDEPQIKNDLLVRERPAYPLGMPGGTADALVSGNINYYFDIGVDQDIGPAAACRGALDFNKESYYVDIDFDCDNIEERTDLYYDIYGSTTEPEVCQ